MNDIIFFAIQLLVAVSAFFAGRIIKQKNMQQAISSVNNIYTWAKSFVVYCADFKKELSGEEKMEFLTNQVDSLCRKYGLSFTKEQIKAIGQLAYKEIKELTNKEDNNE